MAEKKKRLSFKNWDSTVQNIYKDETALAEKVKHKGISRKLSSIQTKEDLRKNLDFSLEDASEIAEASRTLYALDSNYAKIISYYADMFYTRYTITPEVKLAAKIEGEEYLEIYYEMLEKVDGLNLETLLPDVLKEIFIAGAVYLYAEENSISGTTVVRFLPNEFSRTVFATNFGTNTIEFNFEYFDQFQDKDELKLVLDSFPKEFTKLYKEYQSKGKEWLPLDPRVSTSILANEYSIPPFINALVGILEYDDTRGVELEKAHRELQKILIHRIPIEDGMPIFDVEEVAAIQKAISLITRNHKGLETITVFGETKLHELQEEGNIENKRIGQAHKSIFNSAGLNASYFAENTEEALKINRSIDKGAVWAFIQKFNAYINLVLNQLYNFGELMVAIKLLPVTIHEEEHTVKLFRENASFGIGKLDAIVAAGIRQRDLMSGIKLEKELGLDELLTPLQSTHTQSGGDSGDNTEETVETVEEEIRNPDKEEEISEEEVDNSEE